MFTAIDCAYTVADELSSRFVEPIAVNFPVVLMEAFQRSAYDFQGLLASMESISEEFARSSFAPSREKLITVRNFPSQKRGILLKVSGEAQRPYFGGALYFRPDLPP